MADTRYGKAAAPRRGAGVRRDEALHRVGKVTRRIGVATIAAVGILGLYVSRSLPGHATTPAVQTPASTAPTTSTPATTPSSGSSTGPSTTQTAPTAPASPPVTTQRPTHVTSGAS
ncbi:MAG TPA: hypothetical protein VG412_09485 [Acidimicrobiales bacterium]|nr:hypothetical protein [Acidimicrobiales bacterium]